MGASINSALNVSLNQYLSTLINMTLKHVFSDTIEQNLPQYNPNNLNYNNVPIAYVNPWPAWGAKYRIKFLIQVKLAFCGVNLSTLPLFVHYNSVVKNNYCFAKSNRLLKKKDLIFPFYCHFKSKYQNWVISKIDKNWQRLKIDLENRSWIFFTSDHFNAGQLKMRNVPGFVFFKKKGWWFY